MHNARQHASLHYTWPRSGHERSILAAAAICELSLFGNMSYDKISTIINFEVLLHVPDRLAPYHLRGVIKRHGTTGHLYAVVH